MRRDGLVVQLVYVNSENFNIGLAGQSVSMMLQHLPMNGTGMATRGRKLREKLDHEMIKERGWPGQNDAPFSPSL